MRCWLDKWRIEIRLLIRLRKWKKPPIHIGGFFLVTWLRGQDLNL
jgi:hypothetical protein